VPQPTTSPTPEALREHQVRLKQLRGREARDGLAPRLSELKRWQQDRLARTYADLKAQPRYEAATRFFLEDLYGPKDFSGRDAAMLRIYPMLVKMLPASAVQTAALAIEVDALSETLDRKLLEVLPDGPIDDASYAKAYREGSTKAEREHQIELIGEVGKRLDRLVAKPMLLQTLKLMRAPAKVAGLADLQEFLERGFEAFRTMGGAAEFLATIQARERAIASRLFSSAPEPFSL
jgi:hypothetical protein